MKTKLNINRDISIFESKNISGLLVGIDKIVYLDTDIIQNKIEKNDIFVPRYKSGYVLYFLDSAQINAYSITILPRTIYHNNIPVERICFKVNKINKEMIFGKDQFTFLSNKYFQSLLTGTPKKFSRFEFCKIKENGLYKLELYIDNEYVGFVSEFGSHNHFHKLANGTLYLPFEEYDNFFRINPKYIKSVYINEKNEIVGSNITQFTKYSNIIDKCFPNEKTELSTYNIKVFAIRHLNSGNTTELLGFVINNGKKNFKRITILSNTILISDVNENDLKFHKTFVEYSHSFMPITKFTLSDVFGYKTVDILHGFSLDKNDEPENFYNLFIVGDEFVKIIKSNRK